MDGIYDVYQGTPLVDATVIRLHMLVPAKLNFIQDDTTVVSSFEQRKFAGGVTVPNGDLHNLGMRYFAAKHVFRLLMDVIPTDPDNVTKQEQKWIQSAIDQATDAFKQLGMQTNDATTALDYLQHMFDSKFDGHEFHEGGIVTAEPITLTSVNEQAAIPGLLRSVPALQQYVQFPRELRDRFGDGRITLSSAIQQLNDRAHWTREQIADWLESLDLDLEVKDTT